MLGFIISSLFALVIGSFLGQFLFLQYGLALRIAFAFTAVVYIVDLIKFIPSSKPETNDKINPFSFYTIGPYRRFFKLVATDKLFSGAWIKLIIFLGAISIPLSAYVIEQLEAKSFLNNSQIVVAEMSDSFSDLADCKKLEECPKDFRDIVDVIRSYALPPSAKGYVMVVSKDDGIYRTIASEGKDRLFLAAKRAVRQAGTIEDPVSVTTFEPLFNQDFSQLMSAFKSKDQGAVTTISISTYRRNTSRLFRSMHPIDINGRRMVIYITSSQDFLLSPMQKNFLQQAS